MPTVETHDYATGMLYYRKALAEYVASRCNVDFFELFEERAESEIWDLLAIHNKNNYSEE